MERYNIFKQVHKGLRALLYDTAMTLQQTDFGDEQAAEAAIEKIHFTASLFHSHAFNEDALVLPAISVHEPELVEQFEAEHEEDEAMAKRLSGITTIYYHAVNPRERRELGSALNKAFVEFLVFNLEHMAKEEVVLNQALWRHYSDESIMEITARIIAGLPNEKINAYNKWMIKGLNDAELIHWLTAVRVTAPDFIYDSLVEIVVTELPLRANGIIQSIEHNKAA